MSIELKIKAKSLAAEARIIRDEEKKLKARMKHARERQQADAETRHGYRLNCIYHHRTFDVRSEARATHLARAFMAGRPYRTVESSCRKTPPLYRVAEMVAKYHWIKNEDGRVSRMKKDDARIAVMEWREV